MINAQELKSLREKTGASIVDCKKVLEETGDFDKAVKKLMEMGKAKVTKKAGRSAGESVVESYIHSNRKLGVLLEISCETDFVAANEEFKELAHNIAMHIAASNPLYVSQNAIPKDVTEEQRKKFVEEVKAEKKPANIIDKIVEGKLNKWRQGICLLDQPYVKEPDITVKELTERAIAKLGENISVGRFVRFEVGSSSAGVCL